MQGVLKDAFEGGEGLVLVLVLNVRGMKTNHREQESCMRAADVQQVRRVFVAKTWNHDASHSVVLGTENHLLQVVGRLWSVKMCVGVNDTL